MRKHNGRGRDAEENRAGAFFDPLRSRVHKSSRRTVGRATGVNVGLKMDVGRFCYIHFKLVGLG